MITWPDVITVLYRDPHIPQLCQREPPNNVFLDALLVRVPNVRCLYPPELAT
jgi:hypothetical protein